MLVTGGVLEGAHGRFDSFAADHAHLVVRVEVLGRRVLLEVKRAHARFR